MDNFEEIKNKALEIGFTRVFELDVSNIVCRDEVRSDCARCKAYNTSWACPPACGTIEECQERINKFTRGLLLQTTAELEDQFDVDSMMQAAADHGRNFTAFSDYIKSLYPGCMLIGTGGCHRCKKCTYPDEPCRFPDKLTHSMEANGMVVSDVCTANNVKYYYGPGTLTYVACVLID